MEKKTYLLIQEITISLKKVLATVITLTGKNIRYILNTRIRKPQLYQPRQ